MTAVGQGETLVKALQDAVPEDVREKLTASVSEILHAEGTNLKFDKLLDIGKIRNVPEFKSRVRTSNDRSVQKDSHPDDQVRQIVELDDNTDNNQPGTKKTADRRELELHPSENLEKSVDAGEVESVSSHQGDISSSSKKGFAELGNSDDNDFSSQENVVSHSEASDKGSETSDKPSHTDQPTKAECTDAVVHEHKVDKDVGATQEESKAADSSEKILDSSSNRNKKTSVNVTEDTVEPLGSSTEAQPTERDGNNNVNSQNQNSQPEVDQNKSTTADSNPPSFSVSQALDALTGMDDSTQMAVNSVFGVIENMISQLEAKDDAKYGGEVEEEKTKSVSKDQNRVNDHSFKKKEENGNELNSHFHALSDAPTFAEDSIKSQPDSVTESPGEESFEKHIDVSGNANNNSQGNSKARSLDSEQKELMGTQHLADYSDKFRYMNKFPLNIPVNMYEYSLQNEGLHRYLLTKIPNTKQLDVDETTALLLDYIPEEGQWKLLDQSGNDGDTIDDLTAYKDDGREVQVYPYEKDDDTDEVIESPSVLLDSNKHDESLEKSELTVGTNEIVERGEDRSKQLMEFVKNIILGSLKVEVDRRLSSSDRKKMEPDIAREMAEVATSVALAVRRDGEHSWCLDSKYFNVGYPSQKVGAFHGESAIRAISSAVQRTNHLRRVLPVGLIVGSSLAALRKYFDVCIAHEDNKKDALVFDERKISAGKRTQESRTTEIRRIPEYRNNNLNDLTSRKGIEERVKSLNNDNVMVGAVTAAIGASALLAKQQVNSYLFLYI